MTNVPAPGSHASHDLALIAAHAAGDTDVAERERAIALIDACDECARLHADLITLSTAVAAMPAPARPRDFRLTAEQAASLRPTGWRGVLATFSGPRFSFAAPLGTAMATLGLVALLLAGPGLPMTGSSPATDMALGPTRDQPGPESAAGAAVSSPQAEAASPGTGEVPVPALPTQSGEPDLAAGGNAAASPAPGGDVAESPAAGTTGPLAGAGSDAANFAPETGAERDVTKTSSAETSPSTSTVLVAGAGIVLLAGLLLVSLRLIARRVA
jgi:anti-sigma factor RsiW